ncbi:hypothetical protein RRF57_012970 [Xylaria bambusicola]|uniref:Uncharacterized protein n=1 Tax=Xylaria bambusicola TaxID=326684 RepID=A0AAN7UXI0_9PEZI
MAESITPITTKATKSQEKFRSKKAWCHVLVNKCPQMKFLRDHMDGRKRVIELSRDSRSSPYQ